VNGKWRRYCLTNSGDFPGEFQAGDIVGGTYMVLDYLGRGAMGHVYHVRHTMLNTEYALKTLSSGSVTENAWRRFQNEAQAIAILKHPNVVGIYNLGLHKDSLPYYVMDLLHGVDLAQKIRADGPLQIKEAMAIFIEVCAGISYAHKKGIIHRDIKPGNIFLLEKSGASGEKIKVVDFGIAKLSQTKDPKNQELTNIGDVLGTPYYMSPEQCTGERIGPRSDIYSLGCTLFEALTGSVPFRGPSATTTMLMHQSAPPPSLNKASGGKDFPASLEYIIATILAKEPSERYQTMDQLSSELSAVIQGDRPLVVAPGGVTIGRAPALAALSADITEDLPKKQSGLVVSLVIAGCFAAGGFAYWHFTQPVKKTVALEEQLQSFRPKLNSDMDLNGPDGDRLVLGRTAHKPGEQSEEMLPPHQPISTSLTLKTPFSSIILEHGDRLRCFDLPEDVVIGIFKCRSPDQPMQAKGQLKYPERERIVFTPSDVVGSYPDCLKRFQPGDINTVRFDPLACTDQIIKATLNLSDLEKISFSDCQGLTSSSLALLNGLHHLKALDCANSNIDGPMLAQSRCCDNLESLNLPSAKNVLPILEELKKAKMLTKLSLSGSQLTSPDIQALAALSQITDLDLSNVNITDNDLRVLSTLNNLTRLNLRNTHLDASSLGLIKNFRSLTYLDLSKNKITNQDLTALYALNKLTDVHLQETGLDDSVVDILKKIKTLKRFKIRPNHLKKGQFEKIKEGLPGVVIS